MTKSIFSAGKKISAGLFFLISLLISIQESQAQCNAGFQYVVAGNTVAFYDSSYYTGTLDSSTWTFGDGSPMVTGTMATHTYANGVYVFCHTITTLNPQCTDTQCDTIYIGNGLPCHAAFYPSQGLFGSVLFTDISTSNDSILNWYWSFGDGTFSTQQNPLHQYNSVGPFTVCLTIVTATCSDSTCMTIVIQMGSGCQATINYSPDSTGNGVSFYGNTNPPGQGVTFNWSFGDSTFSTLQNPYHVYASSGTYTVCLVVTTVSGCVDSLCQTIAVGFNPSCQAYFSYYQNSTNPVITFSNLSVGGSSYYWTFGDNTYSTQMNPVHTYPTAGAFYVCLTITNFLGTCTSTWCDSVYVSTQIPCSANFGFVNDTIQYGGWFTDFSTTTDSIVSWYWSFGDSTYSTLQNPYHGYSSAGQYQVCLVIVTSSGCASTSCQMIVVTGNNPCMPIFSYYQNLNMFNDTVYFNLLNNNCPGILSVTWNFGDSTSATGTNPWHVFADSGWYVVCIEIITINGTYIWCDTVYAYRLGATGFNTIDVLNNISVFPNPLTDLGTLQLQMIKESDVSVELYSLVGEKIKTYFNNHITAGKHSYNLDVAGINNGMYLLRVTTGKQIITQKISINH